MRQHEKLSPRPKPPKSVFLKTELQKPSFRFLNFEVSLVPFLENRYPTFCTPLLSNICHLQDEKQNASSWLRNSVNSQSSELHYYSYFWVFRTYLSSWQSLWRHRSMDTSTLRRPCFACCLVVWRRYLRMALVSGGVCHFILYCFTCRVRINF